MQFYFHRGACSLASHIALEEAGADHELVKVDFAAGEQRSPEYLQINPKGRVPALKTDRGVLTENPAILAYIAETFKHARLAPIEDDFALGQMQAFNLFLCATVHPAFAHYFRAARFVDGEDHQAAVRAKAPDAVADHFHLIEHGLSDDRTWVHGEHYTVSDSYLVVFTRWLYRDGMGDPNRFPYALKHMRRMNARPAVQRALAAEQDAPIEPAL
jgi:glutathione S-transferase